MCGISGIINFKSKVDIKTLKNINNKILFRGPDDKKVIQNNMGCFGYVRLKIRHFNLSNQPFLSKDKKVKLFYNGEIYNYKKLKSKYFKNKLFSNGDGEVDDLLSLE